MNRFPFYPAPDKRKREASDETDKHQNKSLNSSGVEEPLWPENSVSSHEDSVSVDYDGAESPVGFDESSNRKETNSGGKAGTLEGTCTSKLNNFNMK